MSRFLLANLPLKGLRLVERQRLRDNRGYLSRLFCADELASAGWNKAIAQINHTYSSRKGTVRGLHFQCRPHTEMKLVSVIRGEIWDIAIDLRTDSPTFLDWHVENLSAENNRAMLIPEGFAHGFQTLTDAVELLYFHSTAYNAEAETGLNPEDPRLAIPWPLAISEISQRDKNFPYLDKEFSGIMTDEM